MSKVLFLSHQPLYPLIGGDRLRYAQQLSILLDRCEVDVAYICHDSQEPPLKDFEPRVGQEWRFEVPRFLRYFQAARSLFNSDPLLVNHFMHRPMIRLLDRIVGDYDFVMCATAATGAYMRSYPHVKKCIDMVDSFTMNYEKAAKCTKGVKRWLQQEDARRMRHYEAECRRMFDRVAYISHVDRDYVGSGEDNVFIVGNAVDLPAEEDCTKMSGLSREILFVGKMDYAPNELAVEYFARNVLPLINDGESEPCEFRIVGASPGRRVRELGLLPNVEVTGLVDSIGPYFRSAGIVVAPMLSGSGIQNKILQAMSHGCCVVTTSIGAEGIESLGEGYVVSDTDPSAMSSQIKSLLSDRGRRLDIGLAARRLVSEKFSYGKVGEEFWEFIGNEFVQS